MELNSVKSSISTILKCPICYEEFSKKHEPMIIPCGHTICVNCVVQIIKLSEEEYENYSNDSAENEYEDFFDSDHSDHSSRIHLTNENSAQENESEHSDSEEEEEESDYDDSYEIKFEIDNNIQDFNFDCSVEIEDNKKNFFMGEESKKDSEDGKLIKFKCSLCRKKMRINSKQIIKNIQLSELIKSLDQLHGTTQYFGGDNKETKNNQELIQKNGEILFKIKDEKQYKYKGKIFCNLCKNFFDQKEHENINGITEFHKKNFLVIDDNLINGLAQTFKIEEDLKDNAIENNTNYSIKEKNSFNNEIQLKEEIYEINNFYLDKNNIISDINKEREFYKHYLNNKLEKLITEKTGEYEINKSFIFENEMLETSSHRFKTKKFQIRLTEFLINFLNVSLNYGLSKSNDDSSDSDFDFFRYENMSFKFSDILKIKENNEFNNFILIKEYLTTNNIEVKDCKLLKNMINYVEAFSNFKKCKHKSFMELTNIYLGFQGHLEEKKYTNAEKKLKKANKLLEKFFSIFDKLKLNFSLFMKGKVIIQREKSHLSYIKDPSENNMFDNFRNESNKDYNDNLLNAKNFAVENKHFYYNEDFEIRLSKLVQRKNMDLTLNYIKRYGFFSSIYKNTITSEKRYSTWVINGDYNSKSRLYLFDNFLGENVLYLNYKKLILTTQEEIESGNTPSEYSERSDVYTHNVIPDEDGLNIYFVGGEGNSKNFRVYSLAHKALIKLADLPTEFYTVDLMFHDNKLFILGGANVREQAILNCYYFDVFKKKWFTMPNLNIQRFNKCSFLKNRFIYVYGGQAGYNPDRHDSWSSRAQNQENSFYSTQLWKFEVLDINFLHRCPYSDSSNVNNRSNRDTDFKWKVIEISGFNQKLMEFGFGMINESKLIILGGIQDENEYYFNKGFIIDLDEKKIVERLKIDFDINNHSMSSNFYRGTFQLFLEADDDKVINYSRNFDNLNIFI